MSIPYSGGTIVNTTFTSDGTRGDLVTQLATALGSAGWTTVSGGGTGDVLMSTDTTPQGCSIRLRLYDPGSGNCAQFTLKNNGVPSALTSAIAYLLPLNGEVWRIIANQYQFFMFATGATKRTTNRKVLCGGVPWVPSFVVTALMGDLQLGWLQYNGASDTDTTAKHTMRSVLSIANNTIWTAASILKSVLVNYANYNITGPRVCCVPQSISQTTGNPTGWLDDSTAQIEAIIAWSSTSSQAGTMKYIGMLWDAMVLGALADGESTITFDGHTYMAVTDQADGIPSTLYLAVD